MWFHGWNPFPRKVFSTRQNCAMTKTPPPSRPKKKTFVQTAIRLPPALHEEISLAAERNDRSKNDEMISRLQLPPGDARLAAVERQLEELSRLVRRLLDERG